MRGNTSYELEPNLQPKNSYAPPIKVAQTAKRVVDLSIYHSELLPLVGPSTTILLRYHD